MRVNVVVVGIGRSRGRDAVEREFAAYLEDTFEPRPGGLTVVLVATPEGYVVASACRTLERRADGDYRAEVEAALRRAGLAVVTDDFDAA